MERIPGFVGVSTRGSKDDLNQGNLIHAEAARRLFPNGAELGTAARWSDADIARIRQRHSHLVVVMANGIRPTMKGEHPNVRGLAAHQASLASGIERAGLPVVVLGLGAQMPRNPPADIAVSDETLRLLQVLSAHARSIAVRGAITAEICHRLGIRNVEVIGCQSLFWHRTPQLMPPRPVSADESRPVAFNYTLATSEAPLLNMAMAQDFVLIGQGNAAEADLRAGNPPRVPYVCGLPVAFAASQVDQARYEAWVTSRFEQFTDAPAWVAHMRRYRFAFGTRLHGNMAALLGGTPALWITHDARTQEICEHFRLPHVTLAEALAIGNVNEFMARADYSACRAVYPERYRAMHDYLTAAGIAHALPPPEPVDQGAAVLAPEIRTGAVARVVQTEKNTAYDRYPIVFRQSAEAVRRECPTGARILSFGCSRGDEAMTLAERYFVDPQDRILGVDVAPEMVASARKANRVPERVSFELGDAGLLRRSGPFDAVFAMSVLCVWPKSKNADDISGLFSFETFSALLEELDACVRMGGVMVVFNANYRFDDATVSRKYRQISPATGSSGFVHKFDRQGRRCPDFDAYSGVIFQKIA